MSNQDDHNVNSPQSTQNGANQPMTSDNYTVEMPTNPESLNVKSVDRGTYAARTTVDEDDAGQPYSQQQRSNGYPQQPFYDSRNAYPHPPAGFVGQLPDQRQRRHHRTTITLAIAACLACSIGGGAGRRPCRQCVHSPFDTRILTDWERSQHVGSITGRFGQRPDGRRPAVAVGRRDSIMPFVTKRPETILGHAMHVPCAISPTAL